MKYHALLACLLAFAAITRITSGDDRIVIDTDPGATWVTIYCRDDEQVAPKLDRLIDLTKNLTVSTVRIEGGQIQSGDLSRLSALRELEELQLTGELLTDKSVMGLGVISSLKTVEISSRRVTGITLNELRVLPYLRTLHLDKCVLSPDGIEAISELIHLRELWLDDCALTDANVTPLSKLRLLESLSIAANSLSPKSWQVASPLRRLRLLSVECCDGSKLQQLPSLPNLLTLYLSSVAEDAWPELKRFPSLRTVHIRHSKISTAAARELAALPCLEEIVASTIEIDPLATVHLERCATLTSLAIRDSDPVPLSFCTAVRKLPKIDELVLQRSNITDAHVRELVGAMSLTRLDLIETAISDDAFQHIARIPALTYLNICRCKVSASACASLSSLSTLETLMADQDGIEEVVLVLRRSNPVLRQFISPFSSP